jgi:hypothetical protein
VEDRGFEPLTATTETGVGQEVRPLIPETLAQTLARISANDPGLACVLDAWPGLSEQIRRAILALAESGV